MTEEELKEKIWKYMLASAAWMKNPNSQTRLQLAYAWAKI